MFLFTLAADGGNAFVDFMTRKATIGKLSLNYWHLWVAIAIVVVLMVLLAVLAAKAAKKGKRTVADAGDNQTIDVSSEVKPLDEKVQEILSTNEATINVVDSEPERSHEEEVVAVAEESYAAEESVGGAPITEEETVPKAEPAKQTASRGIVRKSGSGGSGNSHAGKQMENKAIVLSDSDKVDFKKQKEEKEMPDTNTKVIGKIEICNSNLGGFNYILKANNGQLLYESKSYKSVDSCREAIANFIDAVAAGRFSVRADKFKNYKFILKSPTSNNLLYIGESFSTESSCKNNIESVKRFAPVSPIVDITKEDFVAEFKPYDIPADVVKAANDGTGAIGKWEISRVEEGNKNSPFVFLLYANNGQLLYESRDYKTTSSCYSGLTTFVNTVKNGFFYVDPDKSGKYKFVLRSQAVNSPMEYYGQSYDTARACMNSIDSVYKFAIRSPLPENK